MLRTILSSLTKKKKKEKKRKRNSLHLSKREESPLREARIRNNEVFCVVSSVPANPTNSLSSDSTDDKIDIKNNDGQPRERMHPRFYRLTKRKKKQQQQQQADEQQWRAI